MASRVAFLLVVAVVAVLLLPIQPVLAQEANQSFNRQLYGQAFYYLQFPRGDLIAGRQTNIVRNAQSPYNLNERLSMEQYGFYWDSNSTDTWTIDVYVNYTQPVEFAVNYALYSIDSEGTTLGTRGENFLVRGQMIWIHAVLTTSRAPHYPTLEESWGFIFGDTTPLMIKLGTIQQNEVDMSTALYLVFGAIIVNTIFSLLALAFSLLKRGR